MINHFRRHDRRDPRHERRDTLLARLAEAEEILQALRKGDLDALVVQGADGDQVYTLHGAEEPYRRLVEQMREGAVVLGPAGEILYANAQFAALVGEPLESLPSGRIDRFLPDADRADFVALMRSGSGARGSRLISSDGTVIEVYFSLTTTVTSKGTSNLRPDRDGPAGAPPGTPRTRPRRARQPREERVPGDAGARAAQSTGRDPQRGQRHRLCGGDRQRRHSRA